MESIRAKIDSDRFDHQDIFNEIKEHPFLQSHPEQAREVAKFRIRLLNL